MVCLLAAGALTIFKYQYCYGGGSAAVAEKTEDEKAPKGILGNGTNGISIDIHGTVIRITPRSLMEAMRMDRRDVPGLHQHGLVS